MDKKIVDSKKLLSAVKCLKQAGKKIVTINGSFDLVHSGHIRLLKDAKSKGDVLIVLLNSDSSVRMYKGPNRPIVPEKERAEMIASFYFTDLVTIFDEINPKKRLELIKPDIHCNGSDWGKDCVERETVEKNGGRICVLKFHQGHSTTGLLERIAATGKAEGARAVFVDRDGTINRNMGGYVHRIEDFKYAPGTITALKKLTRSNYKIIIVTNQSGIGRGYFTHKDYSRLNRWILEDLKKKGIRVDRVYHCPHHPDDKCACRKPDIQMLLSAVKDFGINLSKSWMVGDDERDVMMGREANVKTIKLGGEMAGSRLQPDYYVEDLGEAINIIISKNF